MNKRFSTLLASALLAGGLSTTAMGAILIPAGSAPSAVKAETYYYLSDGTGANYMQIGQAEGKTDSLSVIAPGDITTAKLTDRALWQVGINIDEITGAVSSYYFINKATGKTLGLAEGSDKVDGALTNFGWAAGATPGTEATFVSKKGLDAGEQYVLAKVFVLNADKKLAGEAELSTAVVTTPNAETGYYEYQLVKVGDGTNSSTANKVVGAVDVTTDSKYTDNKLTVSSGIITYASTSTAVPAGKELTLKKGVRLVLAAAGVITPEAFKPLEVTEEVTMDATKFTAIFSGKAMSFKLNYPTATTVKGNVLSESRFTFESVTAKDITTAAGVLGTATHSESAITVLKSDKTDADGNALYLRMDTASYDPSDATARKLNLGKLNVESDKYTADTKSVINDYVFTMKYYYLKDSVAIAPTYMTSKTASNKYYYMDKDTAGVTIALAAANTIIGVRTLDDTKCLTFITAAAGTELGYRVGTSDAVTGGTGTANLKDGASYYIMNRKSADKDKLGKFLVNPFNNTTAASVGYADSAYYLPASQWTVKKEAVGVYTIKSREVKGLTLYDSKALYTMGDSIIIGTDTLQFFAVPANGDDKHIGYKFLKEEDYRNKAYSISFTDYNGITTYVNTEDSVLRASTEELYVKFEPAASECTAFGADSLENMAYKVKLGDKYIVATSTGYKFSKVGTPATFLLRNVKAESYALISGSNELVIDVKTGAIKQMAVGSVTGNAYEITVESAPEYVLDAARKHFSFTNDRGDKLAMDANGFGVFRKESELKADAYTAEDFMIWVDSAKSITREPVEPSYYIVKNAVAKKDDAELTGKFLRIMVDSAKNATVEKPEYYQAANQAARLAFVPAKRLAVGGDSLLVNYENEKLTLKDSVGFYDKNKDAIKEFQFKFAYDKDQVDMCTMQAENGDYVAIYNDVMCVTPTKSEALLVKLAETGAPTANEGVEVSEVKVITGNGNVQIIGAAGKKVVITNILGQTIANTVITSSDAVIAAPAGVVVVAIEGEEAVKAIVK